MGSPNSEANRYFDEGPVHTVSLDGFWMGQTEVTVGQFKKFVQETGYQTDAEKGTSLGGKGAYTFGFDGRVWNSSASWRNPGFVQDERHPVVCVSWNDATAFCDWLSSKSNKKYTLPSEAQWEYACRAGTNTAYCWGNDPDSGRGWCNASDQSAKTKNSNWEYFNWDDGYFYTSPAKTFKRNNFGLYDMHGNVWEWCLDWYGSGYYQNSSGSNPKGPAQGDNVSYTVDGIKWEGGARVLRGGSWGDGPGDCRSANRNGSNPAHRYDHLGFRVVSFPLKEF